MYDKYFLVNSLTDAIQLLSMHSDSSKIIAGGTDLVLELERGGHKKIKAIIDISRIKDMDRIGIDDNNFVHIGPLVTHSSCISSTIIQNHARCLYQACEKIGSPQIRNRGTIAGNIATASPANDTISALMVLNASIVASSIKGNRIIELNEFFLGVRKTKLLPGEMITDIFFQALDDKKTSNFSKVALRNAQAISIANVSVVLEIENDIICEARIAMGAVSPTIIRASDAEKYLIGRKASESIFEEAGKIAAQASRPISDIRASDNYRRNMITVHVKRALCASLEEDNSKLTMPVILWGNESAPNKPLYEKSLELDQNTALEVNINGKDYKFSNGFHKNLLDLIRENALLTGTKEGCGEGECGACTVFMDGIAVLACLIPAPRAHKTKITTIEGLSNHGGLHKVQESFIKEGAVQCGYCTPGFVMSAVKLLEEKKHPTNEEIKTGISGNLCRCTGYYKIISAIEKAAESE